MTSASRGRNQVAHYCKVDWCHLVKTLEYQQADLVLQTLLNGQPVQSISDVTGDVVVLLFVQYQSSCLASVRLGKKRADFLHDRAATKNRHQSRLLVPALATVNARR